MLLGACRGSSSEAGGPPDSLVVLLPRDAEQLDPRFVADPYGLKVSRLIFASLVTIDPHTLEPIFDLAEHIEVEDEIRYVVRLRPDLRFSDGSALDAADVVATFESIVSPALGSRYAASYRRIVRLDVLDARTVRFELDAPHATFLTDLEIPILRAEDADRPVARPDGPLPIGAGPYRLIARRPGQLELEANPRWHAGTPLHSRVTLRVVHDDNTRALRLLAGAGDVALAALPSLLIPLFAPEAGFSVHSAAGVGTTYLGLQTENGPLKDVRVRRALAHAIDRPALITAKHGGLARLATSFIPPGHWAHDTDAPRYDYDPERALQLLDAAGFTDPDGAGPAPRLRLTLRTSTDRARVSMARAIAAMLRDVGVEVDVRPSEIASLLADMGAGRFEIAFLQIPEVLEPHVLSWFFGSDRVPSETGGGDGANRWRIRSASLDAALERGRRSLSREERVEAYRDVQRILARELPVIPLWHEDVVAVTSARAQAFRVPRDGRFTTLAR